jgi:hypothetical protein
MSRVLTLESQLESFQKKNRQLGALPPELLRTFESGLSAPQRGSPSTFHLLAGALESSKLSCP